MPFPNYTIKQKAALFVRRLLFRRTNYWKYLNSIRHSADGSNFTLADFYKTRTLFVRIPKCGSQSIAQSLYGSFGASHTSMRTFQLFFKPHEIKDFFKCTVVRNPWDRLYSAYTFLESGGVNKPDKEFFRKNLSHLNSFEEFVMDWLTPERLFAWHHFKPQSWFLTDRYGNLLVDFIGYLETLEDDYQVLAEHIAGSKPLLHINKTRSDRVHYTEIYSEEMIAKVSNLYKADIDLFGYQFSGIAKKKNNYTT